MTRMDLIKVVSENIKMLRTEYEYSQQTMANAIGLSKKTLIQIEKGRVQLSWTATCAVCAIFTNSKLLRMTLGGNPVELVETLAHENCYVYQDTVGKSYLFWDVIKDTGNYSIHKNIISEHYRIVDSSGRKLFSSMDLNKTNIAFEEFLKKGDNENE